MADLNLLEELLRLARTIKREGLPFCTEYYFDPDDLMPRALDGYCIGHPPFVELGLRRLSSRLDRGALPIFGPPKNYLWCKDALAAFFDITYIEAIIIFGSKNELDEIHERCFWARGLFESYQSDDIDNQIKRVEHIIETYLPR